MKKQFTAAFVLIIALFTLTASAQIDHNHESKLTTSENTSPNKIKPSGESEKRATQPAPELARAAFETFKSLSGKWVGRSTKGWTEQINFKTIAQGSVVVENSFDAHPNETMMTMYHLDGDRLLLTHYCVSKTQPRLIASSISEDGKTITFTFLDGTGMASRDKGHMDKAVFKFIDENTVTSQWTWYQNGKENWMEEIRYERVKEK